MTAESDEREANWQFFGEDLLEELLEKSQPNSSPSYCSNIDTTSRQEFMVNKLISTVYSGPTIGDIESALSVTGHVNENERYWNISKPIISLPEKGLGKIENKYTIKIKACGNGLSDDGYKWRKYGQKAIKNSPHPRSYYRCTNPRCNAKKQVEKSTDDPDTLIVTYEGLHLHYTYSHFLLSRSNDSPISTFNQAKKPKKNSESPEVPIIQGPIVTSSAIAFDPFEGMTINREVCSESLDLTFFENQNGVVEKENSNSQGLLEDMVPFLVRRPCDSLNSSSCEMYPSDVSSPSDSTLSWAPQSSYSIDMSVLSNIM